MSEKGVIRFPERSGPSAPPSNTAFLYVDTNGLLSIKDNGGDVFAIGSTSGDNTLLVEVNCTLDQDLQTTADVQFAGVSSTDNIELGDEGEVQTEYIEAIDASGLSLTNSSGEGIRIQDDGNVVIEIGDTSGAKSILIEDSSSDRLREIFSESKDLFGERKITLLNDWSQEAGATTSDIRITFPNNGSDTNYFIKLTCVVQKMASSSIVVGTTNYLVNVRSGGTTSVTDLAHVLENVTESVSTGTRYVDFTFTFSSANVETTMSIEILSTEDGVDSVTLS